MLLLQKQLIDRINNDLVDRKIENGNILLPYKAVYGTPTKGLSSTFVNNFQWDVKDVVPIDIIDWNLFLKVRVAKIVSDISNYPDGRLTSIFNLDINRIYLLFDIPIELGEETIGSLRAEFSIRFGFQTNSYVPLVLHLSLYDRDCPENCEWIEFILPIPIRIDLQNLISRIVETIFVNSSYVQQKSWNPFTERIITDYYDRVCNLYKLFRDDDSGPTFVNNVNIGSLSAKSLTEHLRDLLIKLIKNDSKFYTVTKNMI